MSFDTVNIMRDHRKNQIETSPFSETFQIVGGSTFKGIFDKAHFQDNKDSGNVTQKKLNPLIMVSEKPVGLTERSTKIRREGWTIGDYEYTFFKIGTDEEGIPILWLH